MLRTEVMRLTPIEIRQHRFNVRLRGFDVHEVEAFLETVVADFEEVVRENAQLRRDTERVVRELDTYQGRERSIQDTLTTAQGIVEELKRTAMKEAEVVVSEAKLRGEKMLHDAHARRAELEHEIAEMGHLRNRLEVDLGRTLEGYRSLIEAYRTTREAREAASRGEPAPARREVPREPARAPAPQTAIESRPVARPRPPI